MGRVPSAMGSIPGLLPEAAGRVQCHGVARVAPRGRPFRFRGQPWRGERFCPNPARGTAGLSAARRIVGPPRFA
jgi:hypothetical protein